MKVVAAKVQGGILRIDYLIRGPKIEKLSLQSMRYSKPQKVGT